MAGEVVMRQGEPADDVYVVIGGTLGVTVDGHVSSVRSLGEGDAFGEIGLLTDSTRTATVTATTESQLLRIPGSLFLECVQGTPTLTEAVGTVVASRLAHARPRTPAPVVAIGTTP
jgi:CRP-like cAMP-binding protein